MNSGFQLQVGDAIAEYVVKAALGRGGMGEVYQVQHHLLHRRQYAMKILLPALASKPLMVKRFEREALAMHQLEHPNIVRVEAFGTAGGIVYLCMELADGGSLAERARTGNGKIAVGELQPILVQALKGLAHAHGEGVVHRDLKPSNLLFFDGGKSVKIADFGLVKVLSDDWLPEQQDLSQGELSQDGATFIGELSQSSGTVTSRGTYAYMSPEQKRGEDLDARSDVYSFGLMTYRAADGVQPDATGFAVGSGQPHRPGLGSMGQECHCRTAESTLCRCRGDDGSLARIDAQAPRLESQIGCVDPEKWRFVLRSRFRRGRKTSLVETENRVRWLCCNGTDFVCRKF